MCCHRIKGPVLYPVRKAGSILRMAKCEKLNAKCKMLNVQCQMGVRLANIPATVIFKLKRKAWAYENYYYRVIINAKCLMSNAKCEMQNLRCELLYHARSREKCTCPRVISHGSMIRILNSALSILHCASSIRNLSYCTSHFAFPIDNHMILMIIISKSHFPLAYLGIQYSANSISHLAIRMTQPAFYTKVLT